MPTNGSPAKKGRNPFGELIGLRFSACEDGHSRCSLDVQAHLFNPNGVLHGGAIFSLVDTGMGGALTSCLDAGEHCATIEIKIAYLRPVTSGTLICDTAVVRKTRRFAFMESEVMVDGQSVAKAMGTFAILRA